MPETIFHNDFSAGWTPSDNYINGRKNGLLQMDNLCLDDNGALTSVKGPSALSGVLGGKAHTLFSATISGVQKTLAALTDGSVMEGTAFTSALVAAAAGSLTRAAFGNVLDQILICSGAINKKWDGTTLRNAGILTPGAAPTIAANASVVLSVANLDGASKFASNWTIVDGTQITDGVKAWKINPSSVNNLGQIKTTFAANFDTGGFSNGSPAADADVFKIPMTFSDGSQVGGIQVNFYNDDGAGNPDYGTRLSFEFDGSNTTFPIGAGSVVLQCTRADFMVTSPNVPFSAWKTIKHIIVFFWGTAFIDYTFGDFTFIGSTTAVLTGNYQYLQVNVYNNGKYLAQSPISPITAVLSVASSNIHVTPYTTGLDSQVNEIWLFRTNVDTESGVFYLVKKTTSPYAAFDDGVTDVALELADITANQFLTTLGALTSGIKDIIGIYFDRVLYFDDKNVYFSAPLNADSIDSRKTITYSGNTSEVFLWARKVTNTVIIVATDLDMYELSGTYAELLDGTLDVSFRPLAVKNPAVSIAAAVYSSSVVYQAADGWRIFDGINSTPLSDNFDTLFKNNSKYGYYPVTDGYFAGQLFANAAVANKKLYTTQKDTNGTYKCFVFDFSRKVWNVYTDGLYALAVKEDGTIFGSNVNQKIYSLDQDSGNATAIRALFTVDTNGTPRNRKDVYTFKCNVNTNGYDLKVYLTINFGKYLGDGLGILIATINNFTLTEIIVDISNIPLPKALQVQLLGTLDGMVFNDYSIDINTRPTQLTHLTLTPTNFGVAKFKQIACLPFVIDTLGNNVTVIPNVDGVNYPPQTFNTTRKQTCYYYFPADIECLEVGAEVSGTLFEFYEWVQPEFIELRPQRVQHIQRIPDNFGSAAIKQLACLPFIINTLGNNVTYIPIIDGVVFPAQVFNTTTKKTCFYYFTQDILAIDVGGDLDGVLFEFYGWLNPEILEVIQVQRLFDNIGPIEFTKNARLLAIRLRLYPLGVSLKLNVLSQDTKVYSVDFSVIPLSEQVYELIMPRGINGASYQFELQSNDEKAFGRQSFEYKAVITGSQTDNGWRTVK